MHTYNYVLYLNDCKINWHILLIIDIIINVFINLECIGPGKEMFFT